VARLNGDGTLDGAFDACVASSAGSGATALAVSRDGTIFASGRFTFSTGVTRDGIARLRSCGDVDLGYDPQPGINSGATVFALALRTNGTVLLGGNFLTFEFASRPGLVQLTDTGTVDGRFDPGQGISNEGIVYTLALQEDGQAIVAGNFASYDGHLKISLARVQADGRLDPGFDVRFGPNNSVSSLAFQRDGRILVAGKFDFFDGIIRRGLARLNGDPRPFRLEAPSPLGDGRWQLMLHGESQAHYGIEVSTNLADWLSLTNFVSNGPTTPVVDVDSAPFPRRFYRARSLPPGP